MLADEKLVCGGKCCLKLKKRGYEREIDGEERQRETEREISK